VAIRIAIVEDQRIVREAIAALLAREADFAVVGEAATAPEGIALAVRERPDVLILDINLPQGSGVEVARAVREQAPEVKIVALSVHNNAPFVHTMLRAGAVGYIDKFSAFEELTRGIRFAVQGKVYLSPHVTREALRPEADELSGRERQIIALLAEGQRSLQIAKKLGISVATVETHRRNIMRKLGFHNLAELTRYALREGLTRL
jgi:DNA-binding NarL/FixJ family response regulator